MDLIFNGKRLTTQNGLILSLAPPTPEEPVIEIVTNKTGTFTMYTQAGNNVDQVIVHWGDDTQNTYTLALCGTTMTHSYSSGPHTITIENCVVMNNLYSTSQNITSVVIPEECIGIRSLNFYNNTITSFITHSEWTLMQYVDFRLNALNESTINNMLYTLSNGSVQYGQLQLQGGTNNAPTLGPPDGITAKTVLQGPGKSWTVTTN